MGAYRNPGVVGKKSNAGDFENAMDKKEGFKKGGKAMGKKIMSKAERPARKSGGAVLSSASSGQPRGKASHY